MDVTYEYIPVGLSKKVPFFDSLQQSVSIAPRHLRAHLFIEHFNMYKRNKEPLVISPEEGLRYQHKLSIARPIALISYLALVGLVIYTESLSEKINLAVWCMKLLPLVILIPGLIKQTFRTYSWLCFVCLVYFTVMFPVAYTRGLWSDWLMTLIIIVLFISSMMTSRWLQYWRFFLQQSTPLESR